MAALLKVLRRALASTCLQSASVPRCMSNCPIRLIEGTREIEEETLSTYKHRNFCPAHVGEVLNSQYQIVTKSLDTGSTRRYGSAETCSKPSTAHARCSRHRRGVGRPPGPPPPILCDFGEARVANRAHDDDVQPEVYRAPEVILHVERHSKVDVWNLGVMARLLGG